MGRWQSVFKKKKKKKQKEKKKKSEKEDYLICTQMNTVLLGKHQCGFCKGKYCFINLLELQKENNNHVDKIWPGFSNGLYKASHEMLQRNSIAAGLKKRSF